MTDRDYRAELLFMLCRPFLVRWEREHLRELRVMVEAQRVKRRALRCVREREGR